MFGNVKVTSSPWGRRDAGTALKALRLFRFLRQVRIVRTTRNTRSAHSEFLGRPFLISLADNVHGPGVYDDD
jgi:hypothetical protein